MWDLHYMLYSIEFIILIIGLLLTVVGIFFARISLLVGISVGIVGLIMLVYCAMRLYSYTQRVGLT